VPSKRGRGVHWQTSNIRDVLWFRTHCGKDCMDVLLFDLDNISTRERELFSLIDVRINRFMTEQVGIPADRVDGMRAITGKLWRHLQGLIRHHGVDPEAYLHYVHDVNVNAQLFPTRTARDARGAAAAQSGVHQRLDCHAGRCSPPGDRDSSNASRHPGWPTTSQTVPEPYHAVLAPSASRRAVHDRRLARQPAHAKNLGMTPYWLVTRHPSFVDLHLPTCAPWHGAEPGGGRS